MKTINFKTGFEEYEIGGSVVKIYVADLNLGKRINDMYSEFESIREKFPNLGDPSAEEIYELDKYVREIINKTFGADICSPAFGDVNCCSPTADGGMLFFDFLEEFISVLITDMKKYNYKFDNQEFRPEVKKYLPEQVKETEESTMPDVNAMSNEQRKALMLELMQSMS